MSRTERAALCDLALRVGENQPTLCGDWTVKDLVVHLLVREGSPAAVGITVPLLSKVTDLASNRIGSKDFEALVERLRKGPPIYSPLRVSKVDKLLNTIEYFVHHEDIRRAQPTWEPRMLSEYQEKVLWKMISFAGRRMVRSAKVGVVLERSDTNERATLKQSESSVVVRGLPGELVVFLYGRGAQARVELDGTDADIAELAGTNLGF